MILVTYHTPPEVGLVAFKRANLYYKQVDYLNRLIKEEMKIIQKKFYTQNH